MFWNTMINSVGIRSSVFSNFESAKQHHDSVKPIRGDRQQRRPLGSNRRYKHIYIIYDDLSTSVSAVLYDTKCFTVYDNGMIKVEHGGYVTPTTLNFLDAVMPAKFGRVVRRRSRMIYVEPASGREFVIPPEGIWLRADDDWGSAVLFESENLPVQNTFNSKVLSAQYEYKADRKVLNGIRAKLRPFLDTVRVMSSMNTRYSTEEICELFPEVVDAYMKKSQEDIHELETDARKRGVEIGHIRWYSPVHTAKRLIEGRVSAPTFHSYGLSTLNKLDVFSYRVNELQDTISKHVAILTLALSGDAINIRKAMTMIATNLNNPNSSHSQDWSYNVATFVEEFRANRVPQNHFRARGRIADGVFPKIDYFITDTAIENYITEIIKYYYADIVFKKVEIDKGKVPSDTNVKYVTAHNILKEYIGDIVTDLSLSPTE